MKTRPCFSVPIFRLAGFGALLFISIQCGPPSPTGNGKNEVPAAAKIQTAPGHVELKGGQGVSGIQPPVPAAAQSQSETQTIPKLAPAPQPVRTYRPPSGTPDPYVLLEKMDAILRSTSHDMLVTLDVKTKNWKRNYKIRVWMKGVDYAFARVLEPAKSEGQGFLRIKDRLWNYLPTAERTVLIPPSMMLDKFMGSDFSNDDFVKLSYLPRDYKGTIAGEETVTEIETYHLELIPHPDAPVTYGKLKIWLRKSDAAPVRLYFYNEKMEHFRTLHYSEFKNFGGHEIPSVWRMENLKEPERETLVAIHEAAFGIEVDDAIFTRERLEKYP